AQTIEDVRRCFRFGPHRTGPLPRFDPEPEQTEPRHAHLTGDVQTGYVLVGFRGPGSVDLERLIACELAMVVLGEGRSSRLNQRLVEQPADALFYDVGAAQWEYRDECTLLAYGVCRADALPAAVEQLKEQTLGLLSEPVTDAEYEKARVRLEARFAQDAETAMGLCLRVADAMVRRGDMSLYTSYLPVLRNLTPAVVSDVLGRYVRPERLCLVTMAPAASATAAA
ncbi:MAG: insulinase family protein, partial [Armatimonadota bacterium]|nr:insulinase family protein [Armatimonadota bacterium]